MIDSATMKLLSIAHRLQDVLVWIGAALAVFVVLAATWKMTLGNRIIARGDLLLYFYPLREYASAAIRSGVLPLWNPFTFMGAPFLANSQVGFFYPFNVITAWMPVGQAVSWSIALHLVIAAIGVYCLARTQMRLSVLAAFACSLTFGLGGYLGAQVEHLNQLQVLAWLPWQIAVVGSITPARRSVIGHILILTLFVALQVLAGHTQSLYICMTALGLAAITRLGVGIVHTMRARRNGESSTVRTRYWQGSVAVVLVIGAAVVLAVVITAIQLLPTAELATQSARAGGLPINEVGSFSWRPWVIARSLLPTYGDPLFPEYVNYLGVVGLALALLGIQTVTSHRPNATTDETTQNVNSWRVIALVLTASGFVLALGIATPVFNILYRFLPGFNLFRAQARWLILFALGASMLVGYGVQSILNGLERRQKRNWLIAWLVLNMVIIAGLVLGARFSPETEYKTLPATAVMVGWIVVDVLVTILILASQFRIALAYPLALASVFASLLVMELFVASQYQPYSRAADKQALTDLRPSTASLLAGQLSSDRTSSSANRVLALSGLFFDPGDLYEQRLIYNDQLSTNEVYDRVIASKQKEVLSPNLSLYYRVQGVDGYDGGLLPLARYAAFTRQFASRVGDTSGKSRTMDGRLREMLDAIPDNLWLEQMAVRYIITDKTRDVFIDNVYYDMQVTQPVSRVLSLPLAAFDSTSLGLVASAPRAHDGDSLFNATAYVSDTAIANTVIRATAAVTQPYFSISVSWVGERSPTRVVITPAVEGLQLLAMTSIDAQSGAFLSQQIRADHDFRLIHSGDVKIYENQAPAPRAYIAALADCSTINSELASNAAAALEINAGNVNISEDTPEKMVLDAEVEAPGYLVIRDAYYPGWTARIDGVVSKITPIDKLFRAMPVLPGKHRIVLTYEPQSMHTGILLSIIGTILWLTITGVMLLRRH